MLKFELYSKHSYLGTMKLIYSILLCGIVYSEALQAQTMRQNTLEIVQQNCPQGYDVANCTGNGELSFPNGERYVGQLSRGIPQGSGTFTLENGVKFVGVFSRGVAIRGTLFSSNGTPIDAEEWPGSMFVRIPKQAIAQINNVQQVENQRLKAQADEAQRKLAELEEQLKLVKQPSQQASSPVMTTMANRKALVIGNDSYKSVSKLLNAREDARAIASSLTSVGYQVTLRLDLNEKDLKSALRAFANQVQGGDEVLFFFAGHGVQLGSTNYLLPIDIGSESEAQVKDEAIQLQRVLDDMTEKKAKFTLAMIDACRDNPFKTAGRAIGGRGLAPTTAATGQMVVFSAGTGQQALDRLGNNDKSKNSVFTRTFIKEMQKPGVSIDRIVKNVRNEVAELAKTVGHEQVPAIYDQVLGDFYFKK
jgi:hypothetical protein